MLSTIFSKSNLDRIWKSSYLCGMKKFRNSRYLKIFFILCLLTQGLMLFPHHHHNGSIAACFAIEHYTGLCHHHTSDGSCDHSHNNPDIPCCHQEISTLPPSHPHLLPVPCHNILHTTYCHLATAIPCQECQQQYDECRVMLLIKDTPTLPDTYLIYHTRALPTRAGTFIA